MNQTHKKINGHKKQIPWGDSTTHSLNYLKWYFDMDSNISKDVINNNSWI